MEGLTLSWKSHGKNLASQIQQMRDEKSFTDVTLICDGQTCEAHKMVLSAFSPYFKAQLEENPDKHSIIILEDIPFQYLTAILDFMYKGEVNVAQNDIENVRELMKCFQLRYFDDKKSNSELRVLVTHDILPELKVKINFSTKIREIKAAFCRKNNIPQDMIEIMYNGKVMDEEKTLEHFPFCFKLNASVKCTE